jgi:flagellar protein FlaG
MAIQPVPSIPPTHAPTVNPTAGVRHVASAEPAANTGSPQALSNEQVEQTVDEIRRHIDPVDQNLQFSIDKDTGKTIVKLIDSSTKEVLRQIPTEELVAIARALGKGHSGGFIERKA